MPFQVFFRGEAVAPPPTPLMIVSMAAADTSAAFGFRRRPSRGSSRLVSSSVKGPVSATVHVLYYCTRRTAESIDFIQRPNGRINNRRAEINRSRVCVRNVHGFDPMFTGFPAYIAYNIRWPIQVSCARSHCTFRSVLTAVNTCRSRTRRSRRSTGRLCDSPEFEE